MKACNLVAWIYRMMCTHVRTKYIEWNKAEDRAVHGPELLEIYDIMAKHEFEEVFKSAS